MNNKDKNDSNGSSFSDSIELFDSLFNEEPDEKADTQKDRAKTTSETEKDAKSMEKTQTGDKASVDKKGPRESDRGTLKTGKEQVIVEKSQELSESLEMFDSIFREDPSPTSLKRPGDSMPGIDKKVDAPVAGNLTGDKQPKQPARNKEQPEEVHTAVSRQKAAGKVKPQAGKGVPERKAPETPDKLAKERVTPAHDQGGKVTPRILPQVRADVPRQKEGSEVKLQAGKGDSERKAPGEKIPAVEKREAEKPRDTAEEKKIKTTGRKRGGSRTMAVVVGTLIIVFFIAGGAYYFSRTKINDKADLPDLVPAAAPVTQKVAPPATGGPVGEPDGPVEIAEKTEENPDTVLKDVETQSTPVEQQQTKMEADMVANVPEKSAGEKQGGIIGEQDLGKTPIPAYPYSIYFGSYRKIEDVRKAAQEFATQGLSLYWVRVDLGDKGLWHRLFGGYFETREAADKFIKEHNFKGAESKSTETAILVGRFVSEDELNSMMQLLDEKGFSSYVIEGPNGEARLYTGVFYQESQAEEFKAELESNGIQGVVVKR
ncbi:MAG: SPOR domain-containing protein [Deltaproteobacteria bacterium]|nr:SPOR domain-containing protein [Deltaproteobacteria bacterium]